MQKQDSPRHRSQSPSRCRGAQGWKESAALALPARGREPRLPCPCRGSGAALGSPPARLPAQPRLARGAREEQAGAKLFAPKQRSERYASVT